MATIDFQSRVIDRSHEVPVVVDFWAAWCGPCQVLGPVITELSKEAGGKWELVKVDTEADREIAQAYQVMSIPNVKMFHKGEVVAEFAGALPRHQIQEWLDEHIPNPEKEAMKALLQSFRENPDEEKFEDLLKYVEEHPGQKEPGFYLHAFGAAKDPDAASQWLQQNAADDRWIEEREDLKAMIAFAQVEIEGKESFVQAFTQAREALKAMKIEDALDRLVKSVMLDKNFSNELPRRLMIALFHLLGEDHPLSKKYRPRFSMALY